MKHKKVIVSVVFLLLGFGGLQAQESPTASGGEATGAGGTVSYSVGQVVYTTNTGANGSIAQGVQQPYEISTVTSVNEASIDLELNVYPNPTTNYLTLKVEEVDLSKLNFQLYDMQGKLIESRAIITNATRVEMLKLPTSTYFLKVTEDNQVIKTFRIIKN